MLRYRAPQLALTLSLLSIPSFSLSFFLPSYPLGSKKDEFDARGVVLRHDLDRNGADQLFSLASFTSALWYVSWHVRRAALAGIAAC